MKKFNETKAQTLFEELDATESRIRKRDGVLWTVDRIPVDVIIDDKTKMPAMRIACRSSRLDRETGEHRVEIYPMYIVPFRGYCFQFTTLEGCGDYGSSEVVGLGNLLGLQPQTAGMRTGAARSLFSSNVRSEDFDTAIIAAFIDSCAFSAGITKTLQYRELRPVFAILTRAWLKSRIYGGEIKDHIDPEDIKWYSDELAEVFDTDE